MSSDHTPSEHTPSEHSASECSHSADPSGFFTSRPRGNAPVRIETDPYDEHEVVSAPPARSSLPAHQGPRIRTTARKSVPLPRSVNLTNQPRDVGESSRQGAHYGATRVVTGVPVAHPPGMTARERQWLQMMARDLHFQEERLLQQNHSMNNMMGVLNVQSEVSDRAMEVIVFTRREVRTLRRCLAWVIGALVLMMGLLIWVSMR